MELANLSDEQLKEYYRLYSVVKSEGGKRVDLIRKFGWDVKFGYHVVRLLDEVEQILETGDLNLQRSRAMLRCIRKGEVSFENVKKHFEQKERDLETLYHTSSCLTYAPDEKAIKNVLLQCLEMSYGSLDNCIASVRDTAPDVLKQIKELISKNGF